MASYAHRIGLRYGFSRQRSRFTTLVSLASMLGMMIGVASLITVLSVMNGFAGELRDRILALVPHAYIERSPGTAVEAGREAELLKVPGVVAAAPFQRATVLLSGAYGQQGAMLIGMDPERQRKVTDLENFLLRSGLEDLRAPFTVVLGSALSRALGVVPGDDIRIVLPRLTTTPLGIFPRSRLLRVVGIFEVGAQQDGQLAYVSLETAERLLGERGVAGLQLRLENLLDAEAVGTRLSDQLREGERFRAWSSTQGSLFRAIRMEKITVTCLLLGVVFVAAFSIVSTLVMAVTEKRRDIAVLRTLGSSPAEIAQIFLTQGLALALFGVLAGAVLGTLLASNIASIVARSERLLGQQLFDPNVYFISRLPSRLEWGDVAFVSIAAALLSVVAALYPAWRASRVAPAEVLRYE
ncbi:MAG: lipoprotein-releasing ABC transporter permease subunit [Pseudomonadota bacterium]